MPTVVSTGQVLPGGIPNLRWYNDMGYLQGALGDKLLSAFLASQGGGGLFGAKANVSAPPTPQNPGRLSFPGGTSTVTSPQEMMQIQARGGVPARGYPGGQVPLTQPGAGGVSYTNPITRVNLQQYAQQLAAQKAQQDLAMGPTEQAYKEAQTRNLKSQADWADRMNNIGAGGGDAVPPDIAAQLYQEAESGDEDSIRALRKLREKGLL